VQYASTRYYRRNALTGINRILTKPMEKIDRIVLGRNALTGINRILTSEHPEPDPPRKKASRNALTGINRILTKDSQNRRVRCHTS